LSAGITTATTTEAIQTRPTGSGHLQSHSRQLILKSWWPW